MEAGRDSTTVHALRLGLVLAVAAELGIALSSIGGPFAPSIRVVASGEPQLIALGGLVGILLVVASVALMAAGAPITIGVAGFATGLSVLLSDTPPDPSMPPILVLGIVAIAPAMSVVLLGLALASVATGRSRRWSVASLAALAAALAIAIVRGVTYDPFFDPACVAGCEAADPLLPIGSAGSLLLRRVLVVVAAAAAVGTVTTGLLAGRSSRHRARLAILAGAACLAIEVAARTVDTTPAVATSEPVDLAVGVLGAAGRIALAAGFGWWAVRAVQTRVRFEQLADTITAAESAHAVERLISAAAGAKTRLTFALPDGAGEIDAKGEPAAAREAGESATPVTRLGVQIATVHHPDALDGQLLVRRQSPAMLTAVEVERLRATRLGTLRLVRESRARIVATQDAERRRVERDLHDGAQQRILAAGMELSRAASRADAGADGPALREAAEMASAALDALRRLARGVHPAILSQGLEAGLTSLAEDATLPVSVEVGPLPPLGPAAEVAVYRAVATVLAAAVKSGGSHLDVRVEHATGHLEVELAFDGDRAESTLLRIADRIGAAGGDVELRSGPGAELLVHAVLPCG